MTNRPEWMTGTTWVSSTTTLRFASHGVNSDLVDIVVDDQPIATVQSEHIETAYHDLQEQFTAESAELDIRYCPDHSSQLSNSGECPACHTATGDPLAYLPNGSDK